MFPLTGEAGVALAHAIRARAVPAAQLPRAEVARVRVALRRRRRLAALHAHGVRRVPLQRVLAHKRAGHAAATAGGVAVGPARRLPGVGDARGGVAQAEGLRCRARAHAQRVVHRLLG
eukprot:590641-Pyramimonas_sp.AAC.2